jgi:DNA-binding NarL/FixJ family response regulator
VLESIARGLTYRDIADRLGLSANTIPTHIKSICRKLEVRSGAAAVFEAGRRGLIDLSSAPGRDDRQRK